MSESGSATGSDAVGIIVWILSNRTRWIIAAILGVALASATCVVYDRGYRIPSGPRLPAQPPDRSFADQVIALNDQAVDADMTRNDPDAALDFYDRALAMDPEYHTAYQNKGNLLLRLKRYADAAACAEKLTALRPRVAEYYMFHALCYQRLGDSKRARDRLKMALSVYNSKVDGSPFWARLNRAHALFLMNRDRVAYRELQRLHRKFDNASVRQIISAMRQMFDETRDGDRWVLLEQD